MMKKFVMFIVAFVFIFPQYTVAAKETILVIGSYHPDYPWEISYRQALKEVLGDKYDLIPYYMDTKRVPSPEHETMAEQAWTKYKEIKPALVILGDDNALKYLGPRFGETNTPVVYLGINRNPGDYGVAGKANITGVLERPLLIRSVGFLKNLIKPKNILVLFDSGPTSHAAMSEAFKGRTALPIYDITVQLKLIGELDDWRKTVLNLKQDKFDAVVIGLYHTIVVEQKNHVDAEKLLDWTVKNTPVPPFAFWDFTVGPDKAIGGFVLFGKAQGEAAGEIALKILSGKSPGKIRPKIPEMGHFLFSRSQLDKWGLRLPPEVIPIAEYTE